MFDFEKDMMLSFQHLNYKIWPKQIKITLNDFENIMFMHFYLCPYCTVLKLTVSSMTYNTIITLTKYLHNIYILL